MSIEGRIAVDAAFTDLTTGSNTQSIKRVTVSSADAYSTGKVAVVTGTCATAAVAIAVSPTAFRDSSGSVVSFATVTRFAFSASAPAVCSEAAGVAVAISDGNRVSISDSRNGGTSGFNVSALGTATASYSVFILGT